MNPPNSKPDERNPAGKAFTLTVKFEPGLEVTPEM
jgi:hypothetical protein